MKNCLGILLGVTFLSFSAQSEWRMDYGCAIPAHFSGYRIHGEELSSALKLFEVIALAESKLGSEVALQCTNASDEGTENNELSPCTGILRTIVIQHTETINHNGTPWNHICFVGEKTSTYSCKDYISKNLPTMW